MGEFRQREQVNPLIHPAALVPPRCVLRRPQHSQELLWIFLLQLHPGSGLSSGGLLPSLKQWFTGQIATSSLLDLSAYYLSLLNIPNSLGAYSAPSPSLLSNPVLPQFPLSPIFLFYLFYHFKILPAFSLDDVVQLYNFTCYPSPTEPQLYFSAPDCSASNSISLFLSLTIASGYHAISLDLIVCLSFSIFSLHVDNDNIGTLTVTYNLRQ